MALEAFITGRYTAAYGPSGSRVSLGVSREGYRFQHETKAANIDQTDAYGDSLIDMIYRGANMRVNFSMLSYSKAATALILAPWTGDLFVLRSTAKPVGVLASDLAQSLLLTAEANTPAAAAAGPATLTANKVILAPGQVELLYDSRLREVPVSLIVLPYDTGTDGVIRFATIT